ANRFRYDSVGVRLSPRFCYSQLDATTHTEIAREAPHYCPTPSVALARGAWRICFHDAFREAAFDRCFGRAAGWQAQRHAGGLQPDQGGPAHAARGRTTTLRPVRSGTVPSLAPDP